MLSEGPEPKLADLSPHPAPESPIPVGSYDTPFFGYFILALGSYNYKVGYPKKGVWYEPTGRAQCGLIKEYTLP